MGRNAKIGRLASPALSFVKVPFIALILAGIAAFFAVLPDSASAQLVPEALISASREGEIAFLVDKSLQKLLVYRHENGAFLKEAVINITTGQNGGDKLAEGDLKTPEGVYFPVSFIDGKDLLQEYGIGAYPLDYPNLFDRIDGKTGSGIWLHATDEPLRFLTPNVTRGCVVVSNKAFKILSDWVTRCETPVVIEDRVRRVDAGTLAASREEILARIEQWRSAWQDGRLDLYAACYSPSFVKRSGRRWYDKKQFLFSDPNRPVIKLWPPSVYRYRDRAIARFYQLYASERLKDVGFKTLYLEKGAEGWAIAGETWAALHSSSAPSAIPQEVLAERTTLLGPDSRRRALAAAARVEPESEPALRDNPALGLGPAPGPRPVRISGFELDSSGDGLAVRFRLDKPVKDGSAISGRLFIVCGLPGGRDAVVFPDVPLADGEPSIPSKGEWFSIRRFKVVTAHLNPGPRTRVPETVTVFVYDQDGSLLLRREFAP